MATQKVPVYCYQCVAGPDLLKVVVEDGVAVRVEPNWDAGACHPAGGRICVKAYGLIEKTYNPHRITTPMARTNPKKGRGEDPGWVPIGWGEALDLLGERLNRIRAHGPVDLQGYPKLAVTVGSGGIAPAYLGTFAAFLAAWGPVDMGLGSGQGVKCYHSEHLYGEFWHRAFTAVPDTPRCRYLLSFGNNNDASGGVAGVWRHAEARGRGLRRVQFEPHLSVTGAGAEWVPIRPKTDAAVLLAMLYVALHEEEWWEVVDLDFLRRRTSAPYLVGPNGYYLRDPDTGQPLVWDLIAGAPRPFDDPSVVEYAMEGSYRASGVEVGPDGERWEHEAAPAQPAFQLLIDHVRGYTPEWAEAIADVPASTIRRVTREYLVHAEVGATIEIDGEVLPYRPVAIVLGKTVTNGWGGYECCWARTVLACLVGALEVPGGLIGTTVRLNRPATDRWASVRPGPDGFMTQPLNPTDKAGWQRRPGIRNAYRALVPLAADSPWSAALGPGHLAWLFQKEPPASWPRPTPPEVWIVYRANPVISHWDPAVVEEVLAGFPFTVAFAYTQDETNWYADLLLPEATDLESLQLYRIGGTKYIEQFWGHAGFALRQPAVAPAGEARDLTDIATELAVRTGLLDAYNQALNRGAGTGVPLRDAEFDCSLDPRTAHPAEAIWDRVCRAATLALTAGKEERDLAWFREHGFFVVPFPIRQWFLHPVMVAQGLRYELPYQERLQRTGAELAARLREEGIGWWDAQLAEYQALPAWRDFAGIWAKIAEAYGQRPEAFDLWLLTSRSMQYAWGSNVGLPLMAEAARDVRGHSGVILNAATARRRGIRDGDPIWIESPIGRVQGRAVIREGVRPDVAVALQQFGHWVTPVAKDFGVPNLNHLAPISLALTDATGSGADLVRVRITKV